MGIRREKLCCYKISSTIDVKTLPKEDVKDKKRSTTTEKQLQTYKNLPHYVLQKIFNMMKYNLGDNIGLQ